MSKAQDLIACAEPKNAIIIEQEQRKGLDGVTRKRRRAPGPISPLVKAWIDNVVAPALVDQWFARKVS